MSLVIRPILLLISIGIIVGCNPEKQTTISGQIDYVGSADIFLSKQPVHYKYAPKKRFPISVDDNGSFSVEVPIDSAQIVNLHIDDKSYPIATEPRNNLKLDIAFSVFPNSVSVDGYSEPWDQLFSEYRNETAPIEQQISQTLPAFRNGENTNTPELYKNKYQKAQQHFADTPLRELYYKTIGEYLVKRLEEITYRRTQSGFDPQQKRQQILEEAKDLNFFSFESLHAQRAGIRDFTNAFANTFGVADSLEAQYGQELTQYDVKRLGYSKLDSARTSVLEYINDRKARAYAKMHLVAERIGEMSLEVATPSYEQFLQDYNDFPKYTSFLKTFYQQIKRVSPGQPAVPFSLPNSDEKIVQMKDFRGKYVLLDFWASWCIPCLDEFPHMKELYDEYSRENFDIVAISIEEDSLRWRRALQRFDNPWPQLYGGNGFQQQTFQTYRGGGIPFYILVGPEGNILRYNDVRPSFNLPQVLDSLITTN